MNKLAYIFGLVLIWSLMTQFYSCNCSEINSCGTLSDEAIKWFNQIKGDTINFVNSTGRDFQFVVSESSVSRPYEEEACKRCNCEFNCRATGGFSAVSDSAINFTIKKYFVTVSESWNNKPKAWETNQVSGILQYVFLDFYGEIDIKNPSQVKPGDSLLTSLQLGNHLYSDVYVHTIDTLYSGYRDKIIWKCYFTKAMGVIGFREIKSHSLYFRK
jgi:hypothetical protein